MTLGLCCYELDWFASFFFLIERWQIEMTNQSCSKIDWPAGRKWSFSITNSNSHFKAMEKFFAHRPKKNAKMNCIWWHLHWIHIANKILIPQQCKRQFKSAVLFLRIYRACEITLAFIQFGWAQTEQTNKRNKNNSSRTCNIASVKWKWARREWNKFRLSHLSTRKTTKKNLCKDDLISCSLL